MMNKALALVAMLAVGGTAAAERVDPSKIRPDYVGPETPYGETPEEAAAKQVMYRWLYIREVQQDPARAFAQYVSKDFCNHSHMTTRAKKPCAGYDETLADVLRRMRPRAPGQMIEYPTYASVNGEMVTMYGEGVDIFRVHDGKITDHWDASPPAAVSIPAHAPGFKEWVLGDRKGPPPMLPKAP